jgi:hypothetical protein
LAAFSVFLSTYEDSIDISTMANGYYIRAPREQNEVKNFSCSTGKYHSAYSPYAPNELNLPPYSVNIGNT